MVGHDDLPTSELLDPPLATIRMDHRAMGRALMMRLLELGPPDDYVAGVELVERASLQPPEPRSGPLACRDQPQDRHRDDHPVTCGFNSITSLDTRARAG